MRWLPFLMLVLVAIGLGLVLGTRRVGRDEGAVIADVAAHHARTIGDGHCAARPGTGTVWLVVACGEGDRRRIYRIDAAGRIVDAGAPQT